MSTTQRVPARWRSGLGLTATECLVVGVALAFLSVSVLTEVSRTSHPAWLLIAMLLGESALLLCLPRLPFLAFAAIVGIEASHNALIRPDPTQIFNALPTATMAASYLFATRKPWQVAWACGLAAAAIIEVVGFSTWPHSQNSTSIFAFDMIVVTTAAGVVVSGRRRHLRRLEERALEAEATRDQEARRRVAAERLRMAQELHDLVAHNVALVNAQSSVAEYLLESDPIAAAQALRDISEHSRQALDELRATVGLLREAEENGDDPGEPDRNHPMPGLSQLSRLLEAHRTTGAAVTLSVTGTPRTISAIRDLAAYRIVQESLTNAHKHARGADIAVDLTWSPDRLVLSVINAAPPPGGRRQQPPTSGHGIVGMKERATTIGGSVEAQPCAGGGFAVEAIIPLEDLVGQDA